MTHCHDCEGIGYEMRDGYKWYCQTCDGSGQIGECPCDGSPVKPGYRLCITCLEIASANGIDIELYRE